QAWLSGCVHQMTPWHAITPAWVHPVNTLNAAVHAAQTPAGPLAVTTGCAIVPGQPHRYVTPHHHQEVHPATAAPAQQPTYAAATPAAAATLPRSEEHTSELQSRFDLVCRLLLANKTQS